jgi:hypothetical protein
MTEGECEPLSGMSIHAPAHSLRGIKHNRKQRKSPRMIKSYAKVHDANSSRGLNTSKKLVKQGRRLSVWANQIA